MKLNSRLAKRPRYQGLPIPYVQFVRTDGVPDFRIINETKKHVCIDHRLCGLCGERLDGLIAFVGGPLVVQNRLAGEPPMHSACAHDAMRLCPYLCRGKDHFHGTLPAVKLPTGAVLATDEHASDQRPDRMAIYLTRSYGTTTIRGISYVSLGSPVRIEWFDPEGKRIESEEAA